MLAKKRKNMFVSFRSHYDYDDPQNLKHEIKLSVRRGLAAVVADNKNHENDDETMISEQLDNMSIDDMTSIDISNDNRAHYLAHTGILKDYIYTKKCWKAICLNGHLFKDKVRYIDCQIVFFFC